MTGETEGDGLCGRSGGRCSCCSWPDSRCGSPRGAGIASGPDGCLWFTERNANKIGRVTTLGAFAEVPVPPANSWPEGIAVGPDGNIWFTESLANQAGVLRLRHPSG